MKNMRYIAVAVMLMSALQARADAYYNTTAYGFVTASCTGGVTDVYVVNSEWLCVVNDFMSNYWADIVETDKYAFGGGITNRYALIYSNHVNGVAAAWEYPLKIIDMHDYWMPVVRPKYDPQLNTATFFRVSSPDHPAYAAPQQPVALGRFINSIREWRDPQLGEPVGGLCHVVNYSWIKLPTALSNGCRYTVTLGSGISGNFLYDEQRSISWAIHANQVGYLNWAPEKYAYIGAWGGTYGPIPLAAVTNARFNIMSDAAGTAVFSGAITLRYDPSTASVDRIGEYVYQMDFSAFRGTGTFYLSVPGVGRSWPFKAGPDVYGEPFYMVMKGLYQQRSGFQVTSNRLLWARPAGHTKIYRSHCASVDQDWDGAVGVNTNDVIGYFEQATAEMWKMRSIPGETNYDAFYADPSSRPEWVQKLDALYLISNCFGGWYDAGDFDKRPYHLQGAFSLISAYLMNSNALVDGTCNMDESGNGVPDILDEVAWLLRIYRTSQRADGGTSVRFEAKSHPQQHLPYLDKNLYFAAYPDRYSALLYSAAAALFSWAVKPFNPALANDYFHSASNAYEFSQNVSNRVRNISYWLPASEYTPAIDAIFKAHPAMQEYRATPNDLNVYVDFAREGKYSAGRHVYRLREFRYDEPADFFPVTPHYLHSPWQWRAPFALLLASGDPRYGTIVNAMYPTLKHGREDTTALACFLMALTAPPAVTSTIRNECRQNVLDRAKSLLDLTNRTYRQTLDSPGAWGASTLERDGQHLSTAFILTGDSNYLAKAILVNDFMLGCRPMGFIFTTGLGWNNTVSLLHLVSMYDGIDEPSPGIAMYAPIGSSTYDWRNRGYALNYSSSFTRMPYPNPKTVSVSFLPPPFDVPGQSQGNNIPTWRNYQCIEGSAGVCEFTVSETVIHQVVGYGCLVQPGWLPGNGLTNRAPKPMQELYGYRWMP